jgi:autotransporter-associated beta strand protein
VDFIGTGLGEDTRNQILITAAPTLGAWATYNSAGFAAYNASRGIIETTYADIANFNSLIPNDGASNVRINSEGTGTPSTIALEANATTINTLLQNWTSAATVDAASKTLSTNGIMIGSGKAALTIGVNANEGTLTTATAGGELNLINYSAKDLTVNAVIADNTSASSLTKSGGGSLLLSGANTYSGGTTIIAGTVQASNGSALGTGAVSNNATLDIGLTTLNIGSAYTQGAGATSRLMVAVNGATNGSIAATGIATVHADNSLVLNVSNYVANNTTYKIIQSAAGGGAIAAPVITWLGNNRAAFSATAIGDELILTSSRAANGFASDANPGDANARAVGTELDNIHNPSTDMSNILNTMEGSSKAQVATALDTLVPEVDAGVINTGRATLNNFTGVSIDRVEKAHIDAQTTQSARSGVSSGEAGNPDGLWAKGYGSYLTQPIFNTIFLF